MKDENKKKMDVINIHLEMMDINRQLDRLEQKLAGGFQISNQTVLKKEFLEIKNRVLALETEFA